MTEEINRELLNCDTEILYGKYGEKYEYIKYSDVTKVLDKYNNQEKQPITINGYTLEEVITILNALELERILDIKMTMGNLIIIADKMREDFQKSLDKSMENMINNNLETNKE